MRPHCLTLDSGDLCFSIKALLKSWDSGSEKQTLLPVKERPDSAEPEPAEPAESAESAEPAEAAAAAEPEPSLQAWSSKLGIGWTLCFPVVQSSVGVQKSFCFFLAFAKRKTPTPHFPSFKGLSGCTYLVSVAVNSGSRLNTKSTLSQKLHD